MTVPAKPALRDELLRLLQSDLDRLEAAHKAALEGATHAEAKPENSKDTRALEQSYLARGQALRVVEMRFAVEQVREMPVDPLPEGRPIGLGALVTAHEDDEARELFVTPYGGGISLADGAVQVVTISSPLGRALLGKRVGDVCELNAAGKQRELEIVAIG